MLSLVLLLVSLCVLVIRCSVGNLIFDNITHLIVAVWLFVSIEKKDIMIILVSNITIVIMITLIGLLSRLWSTQELCRTFV